MKKSLTLLAAGLLTIGINQAFAVNPVKLGQGVLDGNLHKSVSISTAPLTVGGTYKATCILKSDDGQTYPAVVRFDDHTSSSSGPITFDGNVLNTHQQELNDNKEHTVVFTKVETYSSGELTLTWIQGDGPYSPIEYRCEATALVGLKK